MKPHRAVLLSSVVFGLLLGAAPVAAEEVDDFLDASLGEALDHIQTFVAVASRTEVDEIDVGAGPPR